ncbi:alpha/beta hydrolase [Blastococcus brunescens]|uniref:Alpha/beta hydrolase n=1 Tax=Blastococcus brunescens TaxID=1564165 RepID=A0ABZ1B4U3_9ACTN|nr:alpha/beta hydrolase [Blastococcus sp. BMG 8361]WRL64741.1 alpha/beta hydrolase [Blastococcus sp. BMG 8361]
MAGHGHPAHANGRGRRDPLRPPGPQTGRDAGPGRRRSRHGAPLPARRRLHHRLPATHRALATHLAAASGATVHVLDYRLAPEHPYPAALEDVLAAYWELLDRGATPGRTAVAGDSAGGWLALTAALWLRDSGDPAPAALGLISPWLDLTGSAWPDDRTDAMLRPAWLRRCAREFGTGTDPAELAPLEADLAGLPPITMHVGSEEILLDDAVRLAHRARAAGVPVDLRRLDGLWHVAHASAGLVTASTAAVSALGSSLRAHLADGERRLPAG